MLALATHDFEKIAQAIIDIFAKADDKTECQWQLLDPVKDGAVVERHG